MIEFGKTLRLAREAKGYTVSQLAEMTRMIHQTIEDLENENFTRIAAPIYGRGFVKLYCEAVGLDPKPMVAEFMEIFSGNRELGIKERCQSAVPQTDSAPETIPIRERIPQPAPRAMPAEPEAVNAPPASTVLAEAENEPVQADEPAEPRKSRLSRYAAPIREASLPSVPPAVWRIGTLAIAALAVLWVLGLGFKALYKATSYDSPVDTSAAIVKEQPPETAKNDKTDGGNTPVANAKREKVEVPPLYVD